jgi:hypothetical protein
LAKNTDNLVRAMSFTFHERSSWELRNTHNKNGANSEGHATLSCLNITEPISFNFNLLNGVSFDA